MVIVKKIFNLIMQIKITAKLKYGPTRLSKASKHF